MVSTPYLTLTEMLKGTKAFSADRRKMAEVEPRKAAENLQDNAVVPAAFLGPNCHRSSADCGSCEKAACRPNF
jgi:hypothetical protein